MRGNQTLFSYTPKEEHRLGFMKVLSVDEKKRRFISEGIYSDNLDYIQYLVDIKGDSDKRHLLLYDGIVFGVDF